MSPMYLPGDRRPERKTRHQPGPSKGRDYAGSDPWAICTDCSGEGVVYLGTRGDAEICGGCGGSGQPLGSAA